MTVLEVINRGTEFLLRKGVESPRLQLELLLAHVLKVPRLKLYLNFDQTVSESDVARLRQMIKRRGDREPLQHILKSTSFCGLELAVDRRVLVPRPETELLAEQGWQYLGNLGESQITALDYGTGSGCVAIALAVKCPAAVVHAIDISGDALEVARANAERHAVQARIQFYQGDSLATLPDDLRFHLIISNPPYIASSEIMTLDPEVRDFDPRMALDGGPDGLDFYRRLAGEAAPWLAAGGRLMVEFGDGQQHAVKGLFTDTGWITDSVINDYSQRPRIFIAHRAGP